MTKENRQLAAVSVIINSEQRVLIGHKRKNNKWEYPGGKVEPNEPISEAGRRELFEETGLEPEIYQPIGYFDLANKIVFVFGGFSDNRPELREPHKHYAWHFVDVGFYLSELRRGSMTGVSEQIGEKSLYSALTMLNGRGILRETMVV